MFLQGELAIKNVQLASATKEAEKLLKEISENTAVAEKEKNKVAVIVDGVTKQAAVRLVTLCANFIALNLALQASACAWMWNVAAPCDACHKAGTCQFS